MSKNQILHRISGYPALQFFSWAALSCFNPYLAVILTDRGLDNTHIGLIFTCNAMVAVIAQPVWGMISDRIRSIKKVYIFCLLAGGAIALLVPLAHSMTALIIIFPLFMFFISPIPPLLDNWTYQGVKNQTGSSYGLTRLWGSIGFAVLITLTGRLISMTNIDATSYAFVLLVLLSIAICLKLPPTPLEKSLSVLRPHEKSGAGLLLRNYHYVSFVIILGLLYIAVQPMFGFLAKLMFSVGGTKEMYGWAMALAAISEIPVFFGSSWLLSRFRPVTLIVVSMVFFFLRLFSYSLATAPWMVLLISLLHGLSSALLLVGIVNYLDLLTPAGLKSTALTLASAVYGGLSGMIGNAAAGSLMDRYSIQPVYRLGSYITLGVLFLFLFTLMLDRKRAGQRLTLFKAADRD